MIILNDILIVEDNKVANLALSRLLTQNGYKVDAAYSAEEAFSMIAKKNYDLIVLDLNLPKMNGYHFLKLVRAKSDIPVIVNTAHSSVKARIKLIQAGVSDFIDKASTTEEILESINLIIEDKNKKANDKKVIIYKQLVFDFQHRIVSKDGIPIELTSKEFEILKILFDHPQEPFSRKQLYMLIWGEEYDDSADNTINVHVKRLRDKIEEDPKKPEIIETVYAFGYRLGKPLMEIVINQKK